MRDLSKKTFREIHQTRNALIMKVFQEIQSEGDSLTLSLIFESVSLLFCKMRKWDLSQLELFSCPLMMNKCYVILQPRGSTSLLTTNHNTMSAYLDVAINQSHLRHHLFFSSSFSRKIIQSRSRRAKCLDMHFTKSWPEDEGDKSIMIQINIRPFGCNLRVCE